jgi:hypothetical protein
MVENDDFLERGFELGRCGDVADHGNRKVAACSSASTRTVAKRSSASQRLMSPRCSPVWLVRITGDIRGSDDCGIRGSRAIGRRSIRLGYTGSPSATRPFQPPRDANASSHRTHRL